MKKIYKQPTIEANSVLHCPMAICDGTLGSENSGSGGMGDPSLAPKRRTKVF